MTPDRRLDQLEPVMADVLQKVDRLIEGHGQLVELAVDTKAQLEQTKKTGEITADGLANLTVYVQQGFANVDQGFVNVQKEFANVDQGFVNVQKEFANVDQKFVGVDQKFANVQKDLADVKAGQEMIMQYLREKLP